MVALRSLAILGAATAIVVGSIGGAGCSSSYSANDTPGNDAGDEASATDAPTTSDAPSGDAADAALAPGQHLFSRSFGGTDNDYLSRAHVDLSGDLLLAGSFADTIDFGSGPHTSQGLLDIYFTKFDVTGKNVFTKQYGDTADQNGVNIVGTGNGDIYATGVIHGSVTLASGLVTATDAQFDSVIVRLAGDGTEKESYVLAGPDFQLINGLAFDGSRGVFFTGSNVGSSSSPSAIQSLGGNDVVLGHVMSTQNWSRDVGNSSEQFGTDIAYDPSGSIVAVGYFGGDLDFGDGTVRSSLGGYDVWVARLTPAGAGSWSRSFGAAGNQSAGSVALDAAGNIFVVGTFTGTFTIGNDLASAGGLDVFLAKLGPDGTPIWSKRFGGPAEDGVGGIALAPNGDIILTGRTYSTIDFGTGTLTSAGDADVWLARLDKDGNGIWAKRFGDGAFQVPSGVGLTPAGDIWLAGYFMGTIDLGGGPFTSAGETDVFIARFAP